MRAGYEVTAVENGRLAVEHLCPGDGPRLALVDWEMPEVNGPGVCREVRKRKEQSNVYMVLLTSKESKEDVVAGLESGADDYLTKPFDPEELKARLRTGLRILNLEDRLVEAREKMRFQATHDGLTTLWNRGVIVDLLGRELARSRRERVSTAILMCDLDHFKSVNDTYGHLAGDDVLRESETAALFRAIVRFRRPLRRGGVSGGPEQLQSGLHSCPRGGDLQIHRPSPGANVQRRRSNYHEPRTLTEPGMGLPAVGRASSAGRRGALRGQGCGT